MARYGDRFRYQVGDFADGDLPPDLAGPVDVVVSSRAIHHLPTENKRRLYRGVYRLLAPGGCFFNLDVVGPSDEYLRERYRAAGEYGNGPDVPILLPIRLPSCRPGVTCPAHNGDKRT
jgi:SAM-dependent methyltransferase